MILLRPLLLGCSLLAVSLSAQDPTGAEARVATAQAAGKPDAVVQAVEDWAAELGDAAGVEAEESIFTEPDENLSTLAVKDIPTSFTRHLEKIAADRWWEKLGSPEQAPVSLRWVAGVLEGVLAAEAAGAVDGAKLRQEGELAANFLLKAQEEAGGGHFPFPAWKDKRGRLPQKIAKIIAAAPEPKPVKAGWFTGVLSGGDSLDETAACGLALLHWHLHTKDAASLAAAKKCADWSLGQAPCTNWAQNALPVVFWAELYAATKDAKFLEKAVQFTQLGILPGQLRSGPQEGRWVDPQNARVVPHFLLIRAMAALYVQLPASHALRAELEAGMLAALVVRNSEILEKGASYPETTAETFLYLLEHNQALEPILAASQTEKAAERTFEGLIAEYQQDHPTVTPNIWGKVLRHFQNKFKE